MSASDPFRQAVPVTPSDTVDLPFHTHGLWVGSAGDLTVTMAIGNGTVLFSNVYVGWHPLQVIRVWATGTSASSIVAGR